MGIFAEVEGYISHKIVTVKAILSIIALEAKLAKLSLGPLLINIVLLVIILLSLWLSVLVLAGYFIIQLYSFLTMILIITGVNLLITIGLVIFLKDNLRKMSFEKTRKFLSQKEEGHHERIEEKALSRNQQNGKKITKKRT